MKSAPGQLARLGSSACADVIRSSPSVLQREVSCLSRSTCLPDGSRALIPAQWTDWDEGHCGGVRACREANVGSRALGSLGDLLQLRHLVDALRGRSIGVGTATEGEPSCN